MSRHRPSVDALFESVAASAGKQALGIILTGMGSDGAAGMKQLPDVGCHTIAQNEASCLIYGMPKKAVEYGGVREVLSLDDIPAVLANTASA